MLILGKKHIHQWKSLQKWNKAIFCLVSGGVYAIPMFPASLLFRHLIGKTENMIEGSFSIAPGAFLAASFFSIAFWFENERRFKIWEKENSNN